MQQLQAYAEGKLQRFDVRLNPQGTDFQKRVWQALSEIPFGEVRSYQDIAAAIGNPKAVRAVGGANGKNPIPVIVPCHRVIGADGSLTGFSSGLPLKNGCWHSKAFDRLELRSGWNLDSGIFNPLQVLWPVQSSGRPGLAEWRLRNSTA